MGIVRLSFVIANGSLSTIALAITVGGVVANTGFKMDEFPDQLVDILESDLANSLSLWFIILGGSLLLWSAAATFFALCMKGKKSGFYFFCVYGGFVSILSLAFFTIGGTALATKDLESIPLVGEELPGEIRKAIAADYCACDDSEAGFAINVADPTQSCDNYDANKNYMNAVSAWFNKGLSCPVNLIDEDYAFAELDSCNCEGDDGKTISYDRDALFATDFVNECAQPSTCHVDPLAPLASCLVNVDLCYNLTEDFIVDNLLYIGFTFMAAAFFCLVATILAALMAINNTAIRKAKVAPK